MILTKTMILTGWFFITQGGKDGDVYRYMLEDKLNGIHVALDVKERLEYPTGSYGKFMMKAECYRKFCNSTQYKIMPCVRPIVIDGVKYCE